MAGKVFLNGQEMQFVDGGYDYVFIKPYERHTHQVIKRDYGEMTLQLYDNGVQIRTLVTKEETSTVINRDIAIDSPHHKIYILEEDTKYVKNPDGSIEII